MMGHHFEVKVAKDRKKQQGQESTAVTTEDISKMSREIIKDVTDSTLTVMMTAAVLVTVSAVIIKKA